MEYIPHEDVPYFNKCDAVVNAVGLRLVELQVIPQKVGAHVIAVIAKQDVGFDVSVSDCSKAHRALQPVIFALLQEDMRDLTEDDISMEVCSPGTERNIKNAAEFETFTGREIRVWDKNVGDWVRGIIKSSTRESVTLDVDGDERIILYTDIAKAKFIHN